MTPSLKILIVGGYGTFGGRIVELLEGIEQLTLVIAGRSLEKAQSYCAARPHAKASFIAAPFDRTGDLIKQLTEIKPDIVIDASGPFQEYGAQAYGLIEACITQSIHYLDLADGSEFVAGVSAFDTRAKAANVFVLSGVSSFPVLTAAVVRHLSQRMDKVLSIRGGIAPSPYAGVGKNVIRAIASYAGQRMDVKQAGETRTLWPLTQSLRYTIAPPGYLPLRNIHFSLVDVPDLRVLAQVWPEAHIWMGAGPVPEILHRMLNLFAWLVRIGVIKTLLPIVNIMEFVIRHVRWGEDRGGMFVEVSGTESGQAITKSWHLIAEGRDGPLIPSMAVEAVIHKILAGENIQSGARAALDDIDLTDYDRLFSHRTIVTGTRHDKPERAEPLFQRILGEAWHDLPAPIRAMHDINKSQVAEGRASVIRGKNPLSRLTCFLLRFPSAGEDIPLEVKLESLGKYEIWHRNFNGQKFNSRLTMGRGRSERLFTERFGILSFGIALVFKDERLHLVLRRWRILGIPMPMWLCVKSQSFEYVDENGRFNFDVRISHPLVGLIVHYRGWLLRKA